MVAWLNGALVDEARIDPADRGFTLGDGVFETIRVIGGRPRHLARHFERLHDGAGVLGFAVPHDETSLAHALDGLLAACGLTEATLRMTVTRGPAPRGVLPPASPGPTVLVTAAPAGTPVGPARLAVASVTRRNEFSPLSRIKSLNYLDNILARQEAADLGADDAVLLNTKGRVAETTIANLFAVIDGVVVTPPVAEGALPGIARSLVLKALDVVERPLAVQELYRAREIVLTNSLGVRPVASVDGIAMDWGSNGLFRSLEKILGP
jgi:branched-chain amino acid aminotransferase